MLMRQCLFVFVAVAGLIVNSSSAHSDECGKITIASMNWASAEVLAEIDKLILTAGYGCDAQLAVGDTMPTFASMSETGQPDLVPELWINTVNKQLQAAVAGNKLLVGAEVLADGGVEGWWIPRYISDSNPQIKTVSDALSRPDLFPAPDDDTLGALHNCPPDWGCQISTRNLFRAYGAQNKGFKLVNARSAAELDASIVRAHERKLGWLGYYWAPTALLGRYEMVKLQAGHHDKAHWDSCTAIVECAEPKINAWPRSQAFSVLTDGFAEKADVALDYVSHRQWDNETLNRLLAWMADNQATGLEAAHHFLKNNENIWSDWVSTEVLTRVKATL